MTEQIRPADYDPDAEQDALIASLLAALHQYRDDMRYPPEADSRERRIAMIEALLAKAGLERATGLSESLLTLLRMQRVLP